jgi:hypothetical protein
MGIPRNLGVSMGARTRFVVGVALALLERQID